MFAGLFDGSGFFDCSADGAVGFFFAFCAAGGLFCDPLREGMALIHQKFLKTLEAQGVSTIETDNADFDTDVHEAVAMVPGMGDDKKGKVIDCLQKGYKLNDKVIRHAKVAVGQ